MQTLQQDHVTVKQEPDGVYVWMIVRHAGRLGRTGRTCFACFDAAATAALNIAEANGLPLAADVSVLLDMASPWYSGHQHETVADLLEAEVA